MEKLKVVIPVFGSQVSPRCDCARELLYLEFENGKVVSRKTISMEGMNSLQRIRTISASGATLLVCGVLPGFFRRMIEAQGIRFMHREGEEIDALIEHMKQGEFISIIPCTHRGHRKRRHDRCLWLDNSG